MTPNLNCNLKYAKDESHNTFFVQIQNTVQSLYNAICLGSTEMDRVIKGQLP